MPSVLTRTVRDTAAVLDAVAGPAPGDRGVPLPPPEGGWAQAARRDPGSLRIGVLDRAPEHAPQVAPVVADSVREISGVELADALTWQGGLRARMATWWGSGFDLLLSPVFATPPKPVSWPWKELDGVRLSVDVLTFTAPFNTTGQPAISVPVTITDAGEPIGVQLVAACGREDLLLAVAAQIEAERPWAGLRPPVFAA